MNYIEQIASMLGVKLHEEFTLKTTERGRIIGCHLNEEMIYRFDTELVHKGYNDGYSEWYGFNSKEFYYLCLGLYEIVKIETK